MVKLDKVHFSEHVLRNLIDNSIKYTPTGTITIGLSRQGDKAVFFVKDTGVGINDEDRARLFTEGGRGKDSIKVNVHSTGYGLYIAKQIVDAHGGKITMESEGPGKGSTFKIELPLAK
jgi:signal transduction histidine kinase